MPDTFGVGAATAADERGVEWLGQVLDDLPRNDDFQSDFIERLRRTLMSELQPGLRGEATLVVGAAQTAEAIGSGLVPVFATPSLVALVETAAVRAVESRLGPGETSVGTRIDITHLAATPVGMTVRAEAVLETVGGRMLGFRVTAWDDREKIGEGQHARAIVLRDRFVARVRAKVA